MAITDQASTLVNLFSYGTLQSEAVQLATFGRRLEGAPDELRAFSRSMIRIDDPQVVATSRQTHHPVVAFTGKPKDRVAGMVFRVSEAELQRADEYEVDDYVRVELELESGLSAWVYVKAE